LRSLNNNKQANLFNNSAIRTQPRNRCIIYFKRDKKLQKETKCKIEMHTRKTVEIDYESIQDNINKNSINRD